MVREVASSIPSGAVSRETLRWLEIPLDKEHAVNYLVVTHRKLEELVLVAHV